MINRLTIRLNKEQIWVILILLEIAFSLFSVFLIGRWAYRVSHITFSGEEQIPIPLTITVPIISFILNTILITKSNKNIRSFILKLLLNILYSLFLFFGIGMLGLLVAWGIRL